MSRRVKARLSVVVDRKPAEVFAYLSDVRKHADWSPKPYRVEGVDGPVRMGTMFTSYGWVPGDADHRNDVEVTAFEPPSRIEFTAREKGQDFLSTYLLSARAGGTQIDKLIDMPRPDGVAGLFFPLLLVGLIKPATNQGLKLLKAKLEAGA